MTAARIAPDADEWLADGRRVAASSARRLSALAALHRR